MKQMITVLLGLELFCLGCQTLQVKRAPVPPPPSSDAHQAKPENVPGLPFYVKKASCLHTVVWLEPVYILSLELVTTATTGAAKPTTAQLGSAILSLNELQAQPAQKLFHSLNEDSPTIQSVMKAWVPVATQDGTPYTPTGFPELANRILISNTSEPQIYVDYSQPYYINAKRPVAGSVKLDNKLASDGTLTEVSAEIEDKTIEAIATGIKDITSAVGTAVKAETLPSTVQQLKLSIATAGFKHTISKFEPQTGLPCNAGGADIQAPYKYSRTEVTAASDTKKSDAKGSKITVSGEIVLPEPKASGDAPEKPTPASAPAATKKIPK
jgi:hypothetical protein